MKVTNTHIYFWDGTFSNWHPAKFVDMSTGLTFLNTEQVFMWYKATQFGDTETADKILKTPDPRSVKKLGREVKRYNDSEWEAVRYDIMVKVNIYKFTQNQEYLSELLDTGNKTLVEASPYDKVWGVGLGADDFLILDEKNWKGLNLLGKSLMEVRQKIRDSDSQQLWEADPNCKHQIVDAPGGGVQCTKCPGWFCY